MTLKELSSNPFFIAIFMFVIALISGVVSALIRWYLTKNSTEFRVFDKALKGKADRLDLMQVEKKIVILSDKIDKKVNHEDFVILSDKIDKKSNHEDFVIMRESMASFKDRIGKELERQTASNVTCEKCMIWLVERQGGDPVAMGLIR